MVMFDALRQELLVQRAQVAERLAALEQVPTPPSAPWAP
jgi:hypothetical protein